MNATLRPRARIRLPRWGKPAAQALFLLLAGGGFCYGGLRLAGLLTPAATPATATEKVAAKSGEDSTVRMAEGKWATAGIRVEPAAYSPFTERVWRTGRLALDEGRIAHISPMIEGLVREVKVRLGQDVKAGEVLVVLDCREVGQAKLDLVKTRLAAEYARVQHEWTQTAGRNAAELVEAMTGETPIPEIEKRFKDRTIGDLRQQLITAYSHRIHTKTHYEAVGQSGVQGAVPGATVVRLRADFEAAEATYRALLEEVKYQTGQQARVTEQKFREARAAEALSKTQLMMLGYSREEVEAMDPVAEGPRVSLYPIRAPFGGTVIDQHAVLAERVGPQVQMFQIADLSTLWLQADVPQKDLALVRTLTAGTVRFRESDDPGETREADVFYTGDVVDKATRAVSLTATVRNRDRTLKPGMFVEVELGRPGKDAVQVPVGAVQRQGTQAFVFVHAGGDEFRRVDVTPGRVSGGVVELLGGVKPGQPVVVAGGFVLKSELLKDQMAAE
ncbi:MAG: czcB 1 [Gemmataceae bacterium]|nr:czcB 1 [Gemmataceae bacterium]